MDDQNPRYRCCCSKCHVVQGSMFIGYFGLAIIALLILGAILLLICDSANALLILCGLQTDAENLHEYRGIFIALIFVALFIEGFVAILLLIGIKRENRFLLLPFIMLRAMVLFGFCFRLLGAIVMMTSDFGDGIATVFLAMLSLIINVWFTSVVIRCFQYFTDKARNDPNNAAGDRKIIIQKNMQPY